MKKIEFTPSEIETIKIALQYVSDKKLDIIRENRNILTEKEINTILEKKKKYDDLMDKFD